MSAAGLIGEFVGKFPAEGLEEAEYRLVGRTLIDTLACAIAAAKEPATRRAVEYAAGRAGGRLATVWTGAGPRVQEEDAAWANGVIGHVLDYDDVTPPMRGHPSVAVWPALLACAEAEGLPLARAYASYAVGLEVICRIGRAATGSMYGKGWHTTSTMGAIGATAACCHLLGLGAEATAGALGLAVAQLGGTRENFGTQAKSFQAGHGAQVGLRSARLAALGFTGSATALDGREGWTAQHGAGEALVPHLQGLGERPLELLRSGLDVKKYPMCYAAHRSLDLVLGLRSAHGLTLADVDRVTVRVSSGGLQPLVHHAPRTGLDGKFSLEYAMAAALLDGGAGFASFTDAAVMRSEAQDFLARVTLEEEGPLLPRWSEVVLHLKDGRVLRERTEVLRGSAATPLSDAELLGKFADCCAHGGLRVGTAELPGLFLKPHALPVAEALRRALGLAADGMRPAA